MLAIPLRRSPETVVQRVDGVYPRDTPNHLAASYQEHKTFFIDTMDYDLETLKRIAKRAGDKTGFTLEAKEMPFFLMGDGRKWLKQVKTIPPLFALSDAGKKQLSKT